MEQRVDTTDQSVLKGKLFVGQVPKDLMEDNLRPFFEPYGSIREITIIRDPLSGLSRGCAFVIYHERTSAQNAMDALHNILHLPNATNPLQVRFAETPLDRETKLFVGMLPKSFSKTEVVGLFGPFGEIKEIHIIRGPEGNPQGCAFVKYVEKEAAAAAIQELNDTIPNGATRPMVVRYAESKGAAATKPGAGPDMSRSPGYGPQSSQPQHLRPPSYLQPGMPSSQQRPPYMGGSGGFPGGGSSTSGMSRHSPQLSPQLQGQSGGSQNQIPAHLRPPEGPTGANLFVYHLPRDISDADLATLFAPFGNVISAKVFVDPKTSDSKGFGFVSYDRQDSANNAIASMNGFQIGSKRLKVEHKRVSSALWPMNAGSSGNSHNGGGRSHLGSFGGESGQDDMSGRYHLSQSQLPPSSNRSHMPLPQHLHQPLAGPMSNAHTNRPLMRADMSPLMTSYGAQPPMGQPHLLSQHHHHQPTPQPPPGLDYGLGPQSLHQQQHPAFVTAPPTSNSAGSAPGNPGAGYSMGTVYHPGLMMHQRLPSDRF